MPYISPIVAYVDNRGNLRCAACSGEDNQINAMYADNSALECESCDICGCGNLFDRSAKEHVA